MPRKRIKSKQKKDQLNDRQFWDLWLGTTYHSKCYNPAFHSEEDRRQAWEDNKGKLMMEWREDIQPGSRPGAWWTYEAPENIFLKNPYSQELEIKYLMEWGLLEPWELKALKNEMLTGVEGAADLIQDKPQSLS